MKMNNSRCSSTFHPARTLIGTLRRTHGSDFAKGFKETDKLSDVLHTLDESSLSRLVRDHQDGSLEGKIKQHS